MTLLRCCISIHLTFQVSQGSAATDLRWGENFNKLLLYNSFLNIVVKKLRQSVNICQSYRKNKRGTFLWPTVYLQLKIAKKLEILRFSSEIFSKTLLTIFLYFSQFVGRIVGSKFWKKYENLSRGFWGESKKKFTPCHLPLRGPGVPKFGTLVATVNVCMPNDFWALSLSFGVQGGVTQKSSQSYPSP